MAKSEPPHDVIARAPACRPTHGRCETPGLAIIATDMDGSATAIDYRDGEVRYQFTTDGDSFAESAVIKSLRRIEEPNHDRHVVTHLLPILNKESSTSLTISREQPPHDDFADVYLDDKSTASRISVQVTRSDGGATSRLRSTKSLERAGDTYRLFSEAIKQRISAKSERKYAAAVRKDGILVLDGWVGVNKKMLERFRNQEEDFLTKAGYSQIWFVGMVQGFAIRLA